MRIVRLALAALAQCALAYSFAQAPLDDGQLVGVPLEHYTGFTVVREQSEQFRADDGSFGGVLTSAVLRRDDLPGLVFAYTAYFLTTSENINMRRLRVPGWTGVKTAVWQSLFDPNPQTESADRFESGVIGWNFSNEPGKRIGHDTFTRTMFVLTDVLDYTEVEATVFAFGTDSTALVASYAPVPEPATLVGLGAGLAALAARRRRNSRD